MKIQTRREKGVFETKKNGESVNQKHPDQISSWKTDQSYKKQRLASIYDCQLLACI